MVTCNEMASHINDLENVKIVLRDLALIPLTEGSLACLKSMQFSYFVLLAMKIPQNLTLSH